MVRLLPRNFKRLLKRPLPPRRGPLQLSLWQFPGPSSTTGGDSCPAGAPRVGFQESFVHGRISFLSSRVLTAICFGLRRAVQGHHEHPHGRDWMNITDHVNPLLAELLGTEIFTAASA